MGGEDLAASRVRYLGVGVWVGLTVSPLCLVGFGLGLSVSLVGLTHLGLPFVS